MPARLPIRQPVTDNERRWTSDCADDGIQYTRCELRCPDTQTKLTYIRLRWVYDL
jgi:hypothetical protein